MRTFAKLWLAAFASVFPAAAALAACDSGHPFLCRAVGKCFSFPVIAMCHDYHGDDPAMTAWDGYAKEQGSAYFPIGIDNRSFGGKKTEGKAWPPLDHFAKYCSQLTLCNPQPPPAKQSKPKQPLGGAAPPPGAPPHYPLEEPPLQ